MQSIFTRLDDLRRPKLLVRAARAGLPDYCRERDLPRLVDAERAPAPRHAVPTLLEAEEDMDRARRTGGTGYSVARHVEVLIALMSEARALPRLVP